MNPLDTRAPWLSSSYVVPWYRFDELQAVDIAQRGRLVEDAVERATTHPRVLAAWAVTLAVLVGLAVAYGRHLQQLPVALTLSLALVAFVPLFLVRRAVVRGVVRSLIAQRAGRHDTATRP